MTALLSIAAALLQLPVTPPRFPVARLEISPAAAAVEGGQQGRLTARALDAAGQPVPHAQIEWFAAGFGGEVGSRGAGTGGLAGAGRGAAGAGGPGGPGARGQVGLGGG